MPLLTDDEKSVLICKHTEPPFSGKYYNHFEEGHYLCRQCESKLFRSADKFRSACGWPSFDDAIPGTVDVLADGDGIRTEIVCRNCGGHLGHVFKGEGFTPKNVRYCVNSLALQFDKFEPEKSGAKRERRSASRSKEERVAFAGGCFWGIEDAFHRVAGVFDAVSGYSGGTAENPTYEEVCTGETGHAEAVLVRYNPDVVDYETLARLFFEIHDPTQLNRQGPDWGKQYRSALFYTTEAQKEVTYSLIQELRQLGWGVVTEVKPFSVFYEAEPYHQNYTRRTGKGGCTLRLRRFSQGPRSMIMAMPL